jgi:YHS domain-containing protein
MGIKDWFRGNKAKTGGPASGGSMGGVASATVGGSVEDPVCHMRVDPTKAAGQSTHAGTTYSFCSAGCKTKFDRDPHQYLGAHAH